MPLERLNRLRHKIDFNKALITPSPRPPDRFVKDVSCSRRMTLNSRFRQFPFARCSIQRSTFRRSQGSSSASHQLSRVKRGRGRCHLHRFHHMQCVRGVRWNRRHSRDTCIVDVVRADHESWWPVLGQSSYECWESQERYRRSHWVGDQMAVFNNLGSSAAWPRCDIERFRASQKINCVWRYGGAFQKSLPPRKLTAYRQGRKPRFCRQNPATRILPRHQVSYRAFPYQPNSAALKSLLMATKRSTAKRSVGGYDLAIRA